ncbi:MAG: HAD-IIB family hydrolase, partial [Vampirovibrio sp.]|nr:HAD-IIB family hydrolase [Vampirovibrio sp.]
MSSLQKRSTNHNYLYTGLVYDEVDMIKLVALDLDGTVVDDQLQIAPRVLELLKHLIEETDTKVVVATGRMHPSALMFAQTIGIKEPLISYQGAMIRSMDPGHELIRHTPLSIDLAKEVVELLVAENCNTNVYVNDTLFINHNDEHAFQYAKLSGVSPTYTENLLEHLNGPATKIM